MSLAPAAAKDGFSFAGDLYAEASGHNRHRRATVSELQEYFKSGSDKDHPAHWFEAQLIHYGLQPSKTKSVARMRLFDAVNAGKLAVPSHIQKLEKDLKKEWVKNEREAKMAVNAGAPTSAASSTAASKKRKADSSNVDMNISVGGINITVSANNASKSSSVAKKVKASTAGKTSSKAVKDSPKPKNKSASKPVKDAPKPKASTAKKPKPTTSTPPPKKTTSTSANPVKKQTARRGGISQGPSRGSTSTTETAAGGHGRTQQTARRSGAFVARGRVPTSSTFDSNGGFDDPPPPYQEFDGSNHSGDNGRYSDSDRYNDHNNPDDYDDFDDNGRYSDNGDSGDNDDYYDPITAPSPPPLGLLNGRYNDSDDYYDLITAPSLPPLGLLNGRYDIFSNEANDQWGFDDFDLVLTLSGRELWGKFDLGIVSGILHFDERPWGPSEDRVPFTWRGEERERDGRIFYGNNNYGWIRFLGNGRIEGELDYMGLDFGGERLSSQSTRSQVSAHSMQRQWHGYQ
ncbi:hypothetical protein F5Y12DRAFT_628889 [Xylaria sp. FL1777]|nr:hypothetical protein F5Y12DRAFT_628889 [Xylaria sp. FL1777]